MTKTSIEPTIKISDLMSRNIFYCENDVSIPKIAKMMMENWVDTIFCIDKNTRKVVGIITDGIIWGLVARADEKIYKYNVKDVMYKGIITIDANTPINSIEELKSKFDQSPVKRIAVTSDGKIIGLVRRKFIERVKRFSRHFDIEFT